MGGIRLVWFNRQLMLAVDDISAGCHDNGTAYEHFKSRNITKKQKAYPQAKQH